MEKNKSAQDFPIPRVTALIASFFLTSTSKPKTLRSDKEKQQPDPANVMFLALKMTETIIKIIGSYCPFDQ